MGKLFAGLRISLASSSLGNFGVPRGVSLVFSLVYQRLSSTCFGVSCASTAIGSF